MELSTVPARRNNVRRCCHALICNGGCTLGPDCAQTKACLAHILQCACSDANCESTRQALAHFAGCTVCTAEFHSHVVRSAVTLRLKCLMNHMQDAECELCKDVIPDSTPWQQDTGTPTPHHMTVCKSMGTIDIHNLCLPQPTRGRAGLCLPQTHSPSCTLV